MRRRGSSCSTEAFSRISYVAAAILAMLGALTLGLGPAGAESPLEVAEELAADGVYVAPGRDDVDGESIAVSIAQARALGLRLVVVAPNDPQPDAAAFARRVLEASDVDAAVVFPTEGGLETYVIDEFDSAGLRAQSAARSKATPEAAVEAFTEELLAEPVRSLPPIIGQLITGVLLLAAVLIGVVVIEQALRRLLHRGRAHPAENLPPAG